MVLSNKVLINTFDKNYKKIIIFNLSFSFLFILIHSILALNYMNLSKLQFITFNSINLLILFTLSFSNLARTILLSSTKKKLKNVEECNKKLHTIHESIIGFKHDFNNIVTTIGGFVNTNDMIGLKKYYSQFADDCITVNNLNILNPNSVNNPGILNLLLTKYNEAEKRNIKMNLSFLLDLNNLHMKIYEFARILGILLDNAIEAASECDNKKLNIVFRFDEKNNRNIILVENTYKNKNIDVDEIFTKGFSEKENHSGIGLWEIRQILKRNSNVNLYTFKNNTYFSQQLEIYL